MGMHVKHLAKCITYKVGTRKNVTSLFLSCLLCGYILNSGHWQFYVTAIKSGGTETVSLIHGHWLSSWWYFRPQICSTHIFVSCSKTEGNPNIWILFANRGTHFWLWWAILFLLPKPVFKANIFPIADDRI